VGTVSHCWCCSSEPPLPNPFDSPPLFQEHLFVKALCQVGCCPLLHFFIFLNPSSLYPQSTLTLPLRGDYAFNPFSLFLRASPKSKFHVDRDFYENITFPHLSLFFPSSPPPISPPPQTSSRDILVFIVNRAKECLFWVSSLHLLNAYRTSELEDHPYPPPSLVS